MKKIYVLGGGLVGGPAALDLHKDSIFDVYLVDKDASRLSELSNTGLKTIEADLSAPERVKAVITPADYVLNAVPGFMGFQTLQAIIESGKNVVDMAFFPEDPFGLRELAKERKVTAIVDFGVAPGMSHLLSAYACQILDNIQEIQIFVGGLPVERVKPYEYKAVFSPADVLEEYTRPARIREGGQVIIKEPLSEIEAMDFPGIGTLEAFNSDGIRSLAYTLNVPNIKEKTLRYPSHAGLMKILSDSGFFSTEERIINGKSIIPLEITSEILFKEWKLNPGEKDLTVMKVKACNSEESVQWDLLDFYDEKTGIHSMARTTGYAATMALRMLVEGVFDDKGIHVPEYIGAYPECVEFILKGMEKRGIKYNFSRK